LQDENRYNSTRGAHLNLLRAERARVIVSKIPGKLQSVKEKHSAELENENRLDAYLLF
jgi:protein regulator of cytokinesis 1